MSRIVSRTMFGIGTYADVVISPATTTSPVVRRVSHATRDAGSCSSRASRMASDTWSAILSGCPSVTDSEVNVHFVTASSLLVIGSVDGRRRVEHGHGHLPLVGERHMPLEVSGADDQHLVRVVLEPHARRRDVVGDDEVELLALQLGTCLRDHIKRLG